MFVVVSLILHLFYFLFYEFIFDIKGQRWYLKHTDVFFPAMGNINEFSPWLHLWNWAAELIGVNLNSARLQTDCTLTHVGCNGKLSG